MEIINDLNLVDSINLIKNSVSGNILTDMNIATENITNNSVHQTTELLNTLISKNINNFNNKIINDKTENILKIGSSISLEPFLGMNFLPASSKTIPTLQDGLKKMWASYKDLFILNNQEPAWVLRYGAMAQSGTATDSKSVEPHFAVCGFKSRYLLRYISIAFVGCYNP